MKRTITMLVIIMSLVGLLKVIIIGYYDIDMLFRVMCIAGITIMELLISVCKFKEKPVSYIQLLLIFIFMHLGFQGLEFLLPIVVFKLVNNKIQIVFASLMSIGVLMIFASKDLFSMTVYVMVINLYLYEIKKRYEESIEVNVFNRGQRYESHLMEQKIRNLERYVEQNNVVISLKERNFMAQKLHDHLGHRITSSLMQLEVTKETMGKDNNLANRYLVTAMNNLREGMDEIRGILKNLKPQEMVMGIENIKEQLLKFQYSTGITTSLNIEGDVNRLTFNLWLIVQDNLKEALTNVTKYSGATKTEVSIFVYNKIARVEIRDNGQGYKKLSKSLGLRGIEERVQSLGGRVSFENDDGFVINMIFNI